MSLLRLVILLVLAVTSVSAFFLGDLALEEVALEEELVPQVIPGAITPYALRRPKYVHSRGYRGHGGQGHSGGHSGGQGGQGGRSGCRCARYSTGRITSCPPRPLSNVDTSAEGLEVQRVVYRPQLPSSGRYVCNHAAGSGSRKRSRSSSGYRKRSSSRSGYRRNNDNRRDSNYGDNSGEPSCGCGGNSNLLIDDDVYKGDYGCHHGGQK